MLLKKKKKKPTGFCSFYCFRSIFLRNRSLSNARLFYGKNAKLGREIFIQLKIDLAETKCEVWKIITVTIVICAKG